MPTLRTSRTTALSLALGTALAASVALPVTASAATAPATMTRGDGGRSVIYTAAPGQTNKATVTATVTDGLHFTYLIDDVVPITIDSGTPCTRPDSADLTKISCTQTGQGSDFGYDKLWMYLGDGNDTLAYHNATGQSLYMAVLFMGDGNDRLIDTGAFDGNEVEGGAGADTLTMGDDAIAAGQAGKDVITAGARSQVSGGSDSDTIYSNGEGSRADGGTGSDFLYGGAGRQMLDGGMGTGNDTIRGGTGNDTIFGQQGNDILYGNSGDDTIYGNSGNDKLYGGPGRDTLSGGPGRNVVHQD
ncbi:calcium-binding protein [Streptomyces xylophagus]|uniref:calcium-binding protein n=1 Tax=Streptomyces xylophagus TaxID=285514 RepID=UPI0005BBAE30|nr:calcium-binding protein [Streptomyces xylophagus]